MGRAPTPSSAVRRALLVVAALALAAPAGVLADADPASDVLLLQSTFVPGSPLPSGGLSEQLRGVTQRAHEAGFALKVAVLGSPSDLGAIPGMFGHPQRYAGFLGTELTGGKLTVPLLVVMPAGFGGFELRAAAALRALPAPPADSDGLVRAAIGAVVKLSAAEGHPVKAPSAKGGGGGGPAALVFVVPVILLALAGLAVGRRARRADAGGDIESGA